MINFYLSLNRQGGVEFDCHIQTCFGIVWMVRGAKKVFPTIFSSTIYVKPKSNSLPLLQKQTSFQETKYSSPKLSNIKHFRTLSSQPWRGLTSRYIIHTKENGKQDTQRGHSFITFVLGEGEGSLLFRTQLSRGRESCQWKSLHKIFLIKYLVHKLLVIITKIFVSLIKITFLLEISVLKQLFHLCQKTQITYVFWK